MPCKLMTPIFEKLAENLAEKSEFLKVDVMAYSSLAERYDVRSIPTFVFLDSNGNEIKRIIGMTEYEKIKKLIEELK